MPVHNGHFQVEENHGRLYLSTYRKPFHPVIGVMHLIAIPVEVSMNDIVDNLLVVNNKDIVFSLQSFFLYHSSFFI
jgi:hypothetical protein